MNRIERHFTEATRAGRKSLILFLTAGFPDLATTEALLPVLEEAGCDVMELGVPFSDPVADGPTIQAASTEALRAGTTLARILDMVERFRRTSQMPILLFGAFNPFLHYGLVRLADRARDIGVDGFLVPDLPIEESEEFEGLCRARGLSFVQLVAPTSNEERMKRIAARASGFLYYISLKGVTGTSIALTPALRAHVAQLRSLAAPTPVAIGFGVQTPEHARGVAEIADGVVVGSALVKLVGENRGRPDLAQRVAEYARSLKAAI